jgi:hypothetical protein
MPFAEDTAAFFDADLGFATAGTLDGASVAGIFDNGYQPFDFAEGGASASGPRYTMASTQVPAGVVGKQLVLGADTWLVTEAEPDGTGITTLRLRKP